MKVLFVLGMHRSGTSCLSEIFSKLGLCLDMNGLGPVPERHYEYHEVNVLNDKILRSWREPRTSWGWFSKKINQYRVDSFIKSHIRAVSAETFCIKDPRITLTFPFWVENFDDFEVIGIFRRPQEVARSLEVRDEFGWASFESGLKLWDLYNQELLRLHEIYRFPVLNFNLCKKDFGEKLYVSCEKLKINFDQSVFDSVFLDSEKHHVDVKIPEKSQAIYDSLLRVSHA